MSEATLGSRQVTSALTRGTAEPLLARCRLEEAHDELYAEPALVEES